jgi:hypothetical protein
MSIVSSQAAAVDTSVRAVKPDAEKSHDFKILISVAVVLLGIVVAVGALVGHHGVSEAELGLMTAWP